MSSPFKSPFRYYVIRGNGPGIITNHYSGEIVGIVKIPHQHSVWGQSAIDGGIICRITEPEYSTYEAFGVTVYECTISAARLKDGTTYVYAYNPELYEVVKGKVEPKCIT